MSTPLPKPRYSRNFCGYHPISLLPAPIRCLVQCAHPDKPIVVCGFGAITSLGELAANKETFWTSLKRGNSGFRPLTEHFADLVVESLVRNIKASTVAPVRDFDPARYLRPDFLKDHRRLDPVILYGLSGRRAGDGNVTSGSNRRKRACHRSESGNRARRRTKFRNRSHSFSESGTRPAAL